MSDAHPIYESLSSAAARWSISIRTVRRLIDDGRLEAFRIAGGPTSLRVRPADVDSCFVSSRSA